MTPPGVALLLPGGTPRSTRPGSPRGLASLRMRTFQRSLEHAGVDTELVTYRFRGWNDGDPVPDTAGVIAPVRTDRPGAPIVLVGHSMGGRVALRLADEPGVSAVVVMAPWLPPGEPVAQMAGNTALLIHGDHDRLTDPARTLTFARAAADPSDRLAFVELQRRRAQAPAARPHVAWPRPAVHGGRGRRRPARPGDRGLVRPAGRRAGATQC